MTTPIQAPWLLVDDYTVNQSIILLQRLTAWLEGTQTAATARCAIALSLGETDDPITVANWVDGLALGLEQCLAAGTIDPETNH